MDVQTNHRRVGSTALGAVLGALLLAGCAGGAGSGTSSPPIPSFSADVPTATPTPGPTVASTRAPEAVAEEAALPLRPDEIVDWAKTAVPAAGSEGWIYAFSGWMSEHTAKNQTSSYQSLPPGDYLVQFACRGEGTIVATMRSPDDQPLATPSQSCSNSTVAFDVSTTTEGLRTDLALEGAPTIFAVSIQAAPAG